MTTVTNRFDSNHAERGKQLRREGFLELNRYPTIIFDGTGYKAGWDGDRPMGNLSIHRVNKKVTTNVRHSDEDKDSWCGYRSGLHGDSMLRAADFGMPDRVVQVELKIEGLRQ